jgi:heterodisulfide reductase subunit C/nitrate reductase gamma subunit
MSFHTWLYLSLAICIGGLLWRMKQWLSGDIGPDNPGTLAQRASAAVGGVTAGVFSRRLLAVLVALVGDILLQLHLLKQHPLRWLMHMLVFWGFALLVLMHAFDDSVTLSLFPDYASTLNPFFFLRNLLGVLVLVGLVIALIRRMIIAGQKQVTSRADILAIVLLGVIMISGFLLEAAQIVSEPLFDQMVADYHGSDDAHELAALKAVWTHDYHVVFSPPATVTAELLSLGADLNEESCVACHSRPTAAFGSLPLVFLTKPMAPLLNQIRADVLLWRLHYLACFLGLALLPFTKFIHLLATPLTLALRAATATTAPGSSGDERARLNHKTQRALALDGCTHCGVCSRHCSVAPSAAILANTRILPSEKLLRLRESTRRPLSGDAWALFSEGSFICTECGRCTRICPAGLDLQDLWRAGKVDLINQGLAEVHTRAVQTSPDILLKVLAATPSGSTDAPPHPGEGMDLCDDPATFQACVQCSVCTSVCPVVAAATEPDHDPEIGPHLVTNLLRLRQPDLAQASSMVWTCVTCYQCQEHCPQQIRVADLLYELRNRAWARLKAAPGDTWIEVPIEEKEVGS